MHEAIQWLKTTQVGKPTDDSDVSIDTFTDDYVQRLVHIWALAIMKSVLDPNPDQKLWIRRATAELLRYDLFLRAKRIMTAAYKRDKIFTFQKKSGMLKSHQQTLVKWRKDAAAVRRGLLETLWDGFELLLDRANVIVYDVRMVVTYQQQIISPAHVQYYFTSYKKELVGWIELEEMECMPAYVLKDLLSPGYDFRRKAILNMLQASQDALVLGDLVGSGLERRGEDELLPSAVGECMASVLRSFGVVGRVGRMDPMEVSERDEKREEEVEELLKLADDVD